MATYQLGKRSAEAKNAAGDVPARADPRVCSYPWLSDLWVWGRALPPGTATVRPLLQEGAF